MDSIKIMFRAACMLGLVQVLVLGATAGEMNASTGDTNAFDDAGEPAANLQLQSGEATYTDNDTVPRGTYLLQYTNSISTVVTSYNTTISNVTYSLGFDNIAHIISVDDAAQATKNSTAVTWVFPDNMTISIWNYHLVSTKTDFYSPQYIPMSISREMNRTLFSGEGYQKVTFKVSFENISYVSGNRLCDQISTGINAKENETLNATLLLDTFSTDAPIDFEYPGNTIHSFSFPWNESRVQLNRVYNFSIVIRVVPNGTSPVIFKPYFSVILFNNTYRDAGATGSFATMPEDMLPPHVTHAAASQNVSLKWAYLLAYGKQAALNQVRTRVSSPPVANFTATPRSGTAPLTVRFTDTSTNSPTSWRWTFGDGSAVNSTQKNPVHTYSKAGTYNVSLRASNSVGNTTATKIRYITVTAPAPIVNGITPAAGIRGRTITISNLSGTGFAAGAKVYLNRTGYSLITATNVRVVSAKRITCNITIPANALIGLRNIEVKNTDGKTGTKANAFIVRAATAPTVTALSPNTGRRGTLVTITNLSGTGFIATPKPRVQLLKNAAVITAANVTVVSGNRIRCTFSIPAGSAGGLWNASVTNGDNQKGVKASAFTVTL